MRKLLALLIITLVLSFAVGSIANATVESSVKGKTDERVKAKAAESENSKLEASVSEDAGNEAEEGGHEAEAAWRIPGWQSIFAILAIGYYIAISLNLLPMIAARKVEDKN